MINDRGERLVLARILPNRALVADDFLPVEGEPTFDGNHYTVGELESLTRQVQAAFPDFRPGHGLQTSLVETLGAYYEYYDFDLRLGGRPT